MPVLRFISEHYDMLLELVGLMIILNISAHVSLRMKKLTRAIIILLFLTSVMYELEEWTQTFETLSLLRPMLTSAIYSIYPVILILTMQITAEPLSGKKAFFLLLPEIISVPLFFTSQWTHFIFWYLPENLYQSSILGKWPYFLFGFYSLIFLIHNWIFLKATSAHNRFIVGFITLGPIIGVIMYIITDLSGDYSLLFTSSIVLYYLFIYIHMARIDELTGLFNRKSYYQDSEAYPDRITAVVSVDMNKLKYINDHFGHSAGDTALKAISGVLRDHSGKNGTAYRIGGDEFVILYKNSDEEYVTAQIEKMRNNMAKTSYVCAFGYSMNKGGSSVEAVLYEADKEMYRDKALLKGKSEDAGEERS